MKRYDKFNRNRVGPALMGLTLLLFCFIFHFSYFCSDHHDAGEESFANRVEAVVEVKIVDIHRSAACDSDQHSCICLSSCNEMSTLFFSRFREEVSHYPALGRVFTFRKSWRNSDIFDFLRRVHAVLIVLEQRLDYSSNFRFSSLRSTMLLI